MSLLAGPDVSRWWAPALAFVAGTVSFASPCVLPLVPGYVSFVTGEQTLSAHRRRGVGRGPSPIVPVLLFVMGFSIVFTLLGAASGTWVPRLRAAIGRSVAGMVVVAVGVLLLGSAIGRGPRILFVERRPWLERVRPSKLAALPLGMAFAAGWTPCIGPVLAAVLTAAAASPGVRGALLLFSYSLGLGMPFLLIGFGLGSAARGLRFLERHHGRIVGTSGSILIVVGALMTTGAWTRIVAPLGRNALGL